MWIFNSMPKRLYEIGRSYGAVDILSVNRDTGHTKYTVRCRNCGNIYARQSGGLKDVEAEKYGCPKCRARAKEEEKLYTLREKHAGEMFGSLRVEDLCIKEYKGKRLPYALCRCEKCGRETVIPINRLLQGGATACTCTREKCLALGHEALLKARVDGTLLYGISGNRKINQNNSTGHVGVSYIPKTGKYRAYLTLRRKQYNLGLYNTLEEAIEARKEGEEKYFQPILSMAENADRPAKT